MYNVQFPGLGLDLQIDPTAFSIGSFNIYWYGIIIGAGFLLALAFGLRVLKDFGIKTDDFIDCVIAGFIFGPDRALYSILTYFITSKVIDTVETGLEQGKAVMIITENGERIAEEIYKQLGRTVTLLTGEGLISGKKTVLYCVVTRIELSEMKRIIKEDEGSAFATISDVSEIVGKHIKKKKGA